MSRNDRHSFAAMARSPRAERMIRTLVVAAIAALVGVVTGGLGVLAVVVAVSQPPNRDKQPVDARSDATAANSAAAAPNEMAAAKSGNAAATNAAAATANGSAATDLDSHSAAAAVPPASHEAQSTAPGSAPPPDPQTSAAMTTPQAASPLRATEPSAARVPWPDALTVHPRHVKSAASNPSAAASNASTPASQPGNAEAKDDTVGATVSRPAPIKQSATTRTSSLDRAPATQPAKSAGTATPLSGQNQNAEVESTINKSRPLYDSYGNPRARYDRRGAASRQYQANKPSGQTAPPFGSTQRVIIPGPGPQYSEDNAGPGHGLFSLFGNDNWRRDDSWHRDGWRRDDWRQNGWRRDEGDDDSDN
jgi:hypothetical protein